MDREGDRDRERAVADDDPLFVLVLGVSCSIQSLERWFIQPPTHTHPFIHSFSLSLFHSQQQRDDVPIDPKKEKRGRRGTAGAPRRMKTANGNNNNNHNNPPKIPVTSKPDGASTHTFGAPSEADRQFFAPFSNLPIPFMNTFILLERRALSTWFLLVIVSRIGW